MPNIVIVTAPDGRKVRMTLKQANALEVLENAHGGGCAAVHGYVPSTGYIERPMVDIQMLTRFNYGRTLERKRAALEGISFSDIPANVVPSHKLKGKTPEDWFNARKQQELDSIDRTLEGVRNDAHRQGHDRCYIKFADGIKVHLETEKGTDGRMHPVLTDGLPTAKSIMVQHLELNRKTIQEGIRKTVNSGASVLMRNAINNLLNSRSTSVRTISLKDDNFDSLRISKTELTPDHI
jgi:hypothetical protein